MLGRYKGYVSYSHLKISIPIVEIGKVQFQMSTTQPKTYISQKNLSQLGGVQESPQGVISARGLSSSSCSEINECPVTK